VDREETPLKTQTGKTQLYLFTVDAFQKEKG
jgi:hypothetical protein